MRSIFFLSFLTFLMILLKEERRKRKEDDDFKLNSTSTHEFDVLIIIRDVSSRILFKEEEEEGERTKK